MSETDFVSSLKNLVYEIHYLKERIVHEEKISFTAMFLITYIDKKGPKTLSDISKVLGLSKSTITHLVDGMESKGYLIREYSTEDRRTVKVNMGENGKKLLAHQNVLMEMVKNRLSKLNPEELQLAVELLDRISGILAEQRKKDE